MGENSNISWTDHTWNPWRGLNCYAEAMAPRNPNTLGIWGTDGKRVMGAPSYWKLPEKWNAEAAAAGEIRRVFCASLADVFEEWTGDIYDPSGKLYHHRPARMDDLRRRVIEVSERCPSLRFQCLTKRPQNVGAMLNRIGRDKLPDNWWLGTSVSDQRPADIWIRKLQQCYTFAKILFVSAEPLLGRIKFGFPRFDAPDGWRSTIKWVIV